MGQVRIAVADGALTDLDETIAAQNGRATFVAGRVDEPAALAELTRGADALVVALHRLGAEHFDALADTVRVVGRAGVGLDTIDLEAARRRPVAVVNQPDYATEEVANHAVAMLLALHRRLPQADRAVRSGWGTAGDVGPVASWGSSTVGVVGCGRIGRTVATRIRPFVGEVLVFDPALTEPVPGTRLVPELDELLAASDAVTLHLPLAPATRHVVGAAQLRTLRPGALLVNVSRGGLVDEDALAAALRDGHLGGAGLDVFEVEPLADGSPLRSAPNVLLSPHVAWYSDAAAGRLARWTVEDVVSYANAGTVSHGRLVVDPAR